MALLGQKGWEGRGVWLAGLRPKEGKDFPIFATIYRMNFQ